MKVTTREPASLLQILLDIMGRNANIPRNHRSPFLSFCQPCCQEYRQVCASLLRRFYPQRQNLCYKTPSFDIAALAVRGNRIERGSSRIQDNGCFFLVVICFSSRIFCFLCQAQHKNNECPKSVNPHLARMLSSGVRSRLAEHY